MFTCNICGCHEWHDGITEEIFQVGSHHVLVENIPARICDRCGEANFTSETSEVVRKLIHSTYQPVKTTCLDIIAYAS